MKPWVMCSRPRSASSRSIAGSASSSQRAASTGSAESGNAASSWRASCQTALTSCAASASRPSELDNNSPCASKRAVRSGVGVASEPLARKRSRSRCSRKESEGSRPSARCSSRCICSTSPNRDFRSSRSSASASEVSRLVTPDSADTTISTCRPSSRWSRACSAMVRHRSALLTLVPPNFMMRHRRLLALLIAFPPNENGLRWGGRSFYSLAMRGFRR